MLLAGGDSFTWGNELPDCDESRFSRSSWSALLAEHLGIAYHCVAEGGASNQTIASRVISSLTEDVEFVAVMWTFPVRHELLLRRDHADRLKRKYINVSPWHAAEEKDRHLRVYAETMIDLAAHEYHERQALLAMYSLYSYLDSKKIKVLFSAATTQIYDLVNKTDPLCERLRTANWYRYGEGFYDWAKQAGYSLSSMGHPGPEAHSNWFKEFANTA